MTFQEICVNIIISIFCGLISGIIVAIISTYFIDIRVKRREEYKSKLMLSFFFFEKLENDLSRINIKSVKEHLVEFRNLYEKDLEIKKSFQSVDVGLSNVIRVNENGGSASYDFCGKDYLIFKNILESKIKF